MIKDLLDRTHGVISLLQISEAQRDALRHEANTYYHECGCSMGSFFFLTAVAGIVLYAFAFSGRALPPLWSIGLLILAAMAGKLLGMLIGRVRLFLLCSRLCSLQQKLVS